MHYLPRLSITLLILLILAIPLNAHADDLVNSEAIAGDWVGTGNPDNMTNETTGSVSQCIIANDNVADNASGGQNNTQNNGIVNMDIYGSFNQGKYATGGQNSIQNSGTVDGTIFGTYNSKQYSSGGENIIKNFGRVQDNIYGPLNYYTNATGGGNTITNNGTYSGRQHLRHLKQRRRMFKRLGVKHRIQFRHRGRRHFCR
ncbi:hypothetical protein [Dethiosulfatarculus sandiegensis]|uniref:ESPR domain-containing protein n=1 Tax=Dethiosulfatarculus sandiegensis TaxID=1429043 RepID=A0A0D2JUT1_9BACT|nr:hypothetical protein [Dethiosulfatarculus sandiegensis]KIX13295.1 hypothetical protein X474_15070 [Dethiosulfatarculus sandiegensis]